MSRWGKKSFTYRFAIIAAGLLAMVIMSMLGIAGCGDDTESAVNQPPPTPSEPMPANGSVNQDIGQRLEWLCIDPDNHDLSYAFYFGTTNPPPFVDTLDTYLYSHDRLDFNTTYYWKVIAYDSANDTASSPIWSFTTGNFYLIDNWDTQQAGKINVIDGFIYLLEYNQGLRIFDITDTSAVGVRIDSVGMFGVGYANYGMAIDGDKAFLSKDQGFTLVDLANINEPHLLYSTGTALYSPNENLRDIKIIHEAPNRFAVTTSIDTTNIDNPVSQFKIIRANGDDSTTLAWTIEGELQYDGLGVDLEISGNYAFVADSANGLAVFDISDMTNPTLEVTLPTNGTPNRLFLDGNYAYIADGDAGLTIVNIATPASPTIVGHVDTPGKARDICVLETTAFVAAYWDGGLQVIDVSNPAAPEIIDSRASHGGAAGVFATYDTIDGETHPLVYFGDTFMGLYVYEYNLQ